TVAYDSELLIEEMPFHEFVQRQEEGIYINNNHTILASFPELFDDIKEPVEHLIDSLPSTNLRNVHIANLFIGSSIENIKGSNMHCGGSSNMFIQIKGRKTWTLIDPEYSCLLKGRVAQNGIHAQTLFDMLDQKLDQT